MIELLPWQQAHQRLCRQLIDAGLLSEAEGDGRPLLSLNCDPPSAGEVQPMLYPMWSATATQQDRQRARNILDAFDWRPRRPRADAALDADLEALPPARQLRLWLRYLRRLERRQPGLIRSLGEQIDGDEPAEGGG